MIAHTKVSANHRMARGVTLQCLEAGDQPTQIRHCLISTQRKQKMSVLFRYRGLPMEVMDGGTRAHAQDRCLLQALRPVLGIGTVACIAMGAHEARGPITSILESIRTPGRQAGSQSFSSAGKGSGKDGDFAWLGSL